MVFKVNLEAGNAVEDIVVFLSDANVPRHLLLFFVPMLVGFLTGLTIIFALLVDFFVNPALMALVTGQAPKMSPVGPESIKNAAV